VKELWKSAYTCGSCDQKSCVLFSFETQSRRSQHSQECKDPRRHKQRWKPYSRDYRGSG